MTMNIEFASAHLVPGVFFLSLIPAFRSVFSVIILQVYYAAVKEPVMKELKRLPTSLLFKTNFNYKFLKFLPLGSLLFFPLMTIRLVKIVRSPVVLSFYKALRLLNWNFDPN